jgi:hypothetical protein
MKEQLISFETAKLAKEKGFTEIQDTFFDAITEKGENGFNPSSRRDIERQFNNELFFRPTQSLLQKWLREYHGIIVLVGYYDDDEKQWFYSFPLKPRELQEDEYYDTYEEALEAGLQTALKKI